jgi:hypothetical protein
MRKVASALAIGLGVLAGLAAILPAEARGFGGGAGGGHVDGIGGAGGVGGVGGVAGAGHDGFGPGGAGYGMQGAGRPNPYARNAVPFINMNYNDLLQTPPNNSGSRPPNDCNYLFQKATESGDSGMWRLFNDCAHNR